MIIPLGLNIIMAYYIITQENGRNLVFYKWFIAYGKVAILFNVFASANIELLNILHSNWTGFPFFRASFSARARRIIFLCTCLNILIGEIPQVIIQVRFFFKYIYTLFIFVVY